MPNAARPAPEIPDHEVLRKIGGGAYGEVWLAKSVTGAWRAVKVVRREDFEDDRTFEREFEGIQKYEPISRDHPSLVHILHVGRGEDEYSRFYHYVMELGDDVENGQNIHPVEYEPLTLRSGGSLKGRKAMPVAQVIKVGIALAQGLEHLHQHGLAHRDIKPANIIFHHGHAKLADIGLVAARGQRSFVGTDGFVPPEGPGAASGDIYSLGKVLYELSTGLDRMQFPELPEEIPDGEERSIWLRLNEVICTVCDPELARRKIKTGAELAEALRLIESGKRYRQRRVRWIYSSIVFLLCVGVLIYFIDQKQYFQKKNLQQLPKSNITDLVVEQEERNHLLIRTVPSDVSITLLDGTPLLDFQGRKVENGTGFVRVELAVGSQLQLKFTKEGYKPEYSGLLEIPASESGELELEASLYRFRPPSKDERWTDSQEMSYTPVDGGHLSDQALTLSAYEQYLKATQAQAPGPKTLSLSHLGKAYNAVLITPEEFNAYAKWAMQRGLELGTLEGDEDWIGHIDTRISEQQIGDSAIAAGLHPWRIRVEKVRFAQLKIESEPSGALVFQDGKILGVTPYVIEKLRPGPYLYQVTLQGYKNEMVQGNLDPEQKALKVLKLVQDDSVVFGKSWTNSLGQNFVPLSPHLLVATWETRISDYKIFLKENPKTKTRPSMLQAGESHPISDVTREEAMAFCDWLTSKERKLGRIGPLHRYRLPTDSEWSAMNGVDEKKELTPGQRAGVLLHQYSWGEIWPPSHLEAPVENLADSKAAGRTNIPARETIPNYHDGFAQTAPVASFVANKLELFDLGGNVKEWILDDNGAGKKFKNYHVARGGCYLSYTDAQLDIAARDIQPPGTHEDYIGFRVVLTNEGQRSSIIPK